MGYAEVLLTEQGLRLITPLLPRSGQTLAEASRDEKVMTGVNKDFGYTLMPDFREIMKTSTPTQSNHSLL
jgi:hypothetical protein